VGILSDFFIATPEQAVRYAKRYDEPDKGNTITQLLKPLELKNLTGLEMGTLWAILEGVEWDVDKHMLEEVLHDESSGVERFPDELIQLLVRADKTEIEAACSPWAATEELNCSPSEALSVLHGIQVLAIRSDREGKSLYLWTSC